MGQKILLISICCVLNSFFRCRPTNKNRNQEGHEERRLSSQLPHHWLFDNSFPKLLASRPCFLELSIEFKTLDQDLLEFLRILFYKILKILIINFKLNCPNFTKSISTPFINLIFTTYNKNKSSLLECTIYLFNI